MSTDGKGRALDNVAIERFWRSLKYEEVYLKDYADLPEARREIGRYIERYNSFVRISLSEVEHRIPSMLKAAVRAPPDQSKSCQDVVLALGSTAIPPSVIPLRRGGRTMPCHCRPVEMSTPLSSISETKLRRIS